MRRMQPPTQYGPHENQVFLLPVTANGGLGHPSDWGTETAAAPLDRTLHEEGAGQGRPAIGRQGGPEHMKEPTPADVHPFTAGCGFWEGARLLLFAVAAPEHPETRYRPKLRREVIINQ